MSFPGFDSSFLFSTEEYSSLDVPTVYLSVYLLKDTLIAPKFWDLGVKLL